MSTKTVPASEHAVPQRVLRRIFDRVDIRSADECWLWTLSIGSHGYGQVGWWIGDRSVMTTAHRVVWMAVFGPIPEGQTVDHKCRNRPCCNPSHLRLLTNVDNATDNGAGRRTHCPQGHAYTAENTIITGKGHRNCRTCKNESNRRWYAQRSAGS